MVLLLLGSTVLSHTGIISMLVSILGYTVYIPFLFLFFSRRQPVNRLSDFPQLISFDSPLSTNGLHFVIQRTDAGFDPLLGRVLGIS